MDVLHGRGFRETRAVHARIHARSIVCSTDGRTDKRMGDCYTQLSLVVRGSSKVANRAPLCTVVIRDWCWINCRPARKYSDSPVGKQRRYFTISSRLSPDIVTGRRRLRAVSKPWQAWPRWLGHQLRDAARSLISTPRSLRSGIFFGFSLSLFREPYLGHGLMEFFVRLSFSLPSLLAHLISAFCDSLLVIVEKF